LHPIQYLSRKTKPAEEKYHSYEPEVLAIAEALKKWRVFLLGIKFKIITDCNAFPLTMKKRGEIPLRVARWALFLENYDYVIEHQSGSKMRHVVFQVLCWKTLCIISCRKHSRMMNGFGQ